MKTKLRFLFIIGVVLSLSSCVEVFQYISVKDGNVSIYLKYVIQKAIFEMAASFSGEEMDYEEYLGDGQEFLSDFEGITTDSRPINTDLEVGFEITIQGTLEQMRIDTETQAIPFAPEPRGEKYYLTIPGMGSSSSDDEWGMAFLASSKYRILLDLSGDLSGIRNARLIFDEESVDPDSESDALITTTLLGQNLLVEMPMLVPFMSEESVTIELF